MSLEFTVTSLDPTGQQLRRQERRATQQAHDRLHAKLQQLGLLVGLTSGQVNVGSRERGVQAHRNPASNAARHEAYELAARLEATLPDHAGTALAHRAQLVMVLLDPPGADRLAEHLSQARALLD